MDQNGQWSVQLKMTIIMALSPRFKVELSLLVVTETDVDLLNFSTIQGKFITDVSQTFTQTINRFLIIDI